MTSNTRASGIAAAVVSLVGLGSAGHVVEDRATISLADKSCHSKKGCEKEHGKGEKENVHKEFASNR